MPSIKTSVKIKDNLKGLKSLDKKLRKSKDNLAEVGHFEGHVHDEDTGMTVAEVSVINQMGMGRIPSRPYMEIALNSPVFMKAFMDAAKRIALGGRSKNGKSTQTFSTELPKLAKILEEVMRGVIMSGQGLARNHPVTIRKKGKDSPLIHTQTLLDDIEHRLVKEVGRMKNTGKNKVAQNV